MTPRWYIPRRTVLRGIGTSVALPLLEAMSPPKVKAAAASPRRFVGIFAFPNGLVGKWDPLQNTPVSPWTPEREGPFGSTPPPESKGWLDPFWDPKNQRPGGEPLWKKLTILTGLSDISMDIHAEIAAMLTPGRVQCNSIGSGNSCLDYTYDLHGPSLDQVIAKDFGRYTPDMPVLALGTHPPYYDDIPYSSYISWKDRTTPETKYIDPDIVFNKLFSGNVNPKEDAASAARRKLFQKSVLDEVLVHATGIKKRVGTADQDKLTQYFDGIRDIEKNIERVTGPLACTVPTIAPNAEKLPLNNPQLWINQLDQRLKLMMDLLVKAFECDRTRVATLTYIRAYGASYGYPFLTTALEDGTSFNLGGYYNHDMSHYLDPRMDAGHQGTFPQRYAYMNAWGRWQVKMYAYLLGQLDKVVDDYATDTTMLDNTITHITGDECDGDTHSWTSMNILLGGRGGRNGARWGLNAGRHVRINGRWPDASCGYMAPSFEKVGAAAKFYCRDASGESPTEPWRFTDLQFKGERTVKDLLWGMLHALGIDQTAAQQWANLGHATAPLDLTFPGKL